MTTTHGIRGPAPPARAQPPPEAGPQPQHLDSAEPRQHHSERKLQ